MPYALENALYQWQEGERLLRAAPQERVAGLERAVASVVDELRRRLGSSFRLAELVELYGEGTDWADDVVQRSYAGIDSAVAVDAAFARYARQASDFAGGRAHRREER